MSGLLAPSQSFFCFANLSLLLLAFTIHVGPVCCCSWSGGTSSLLAVLLPSEGFWWFLVASRCVWSLAPSHNFLCFADLSFLVLAFSTSRRLCRLLLLVRWRLVASGCSGAFWWLLKVSGGFCLFLLVSGCFWSCLVFGTVPQFLVLC